MRVLMDQVTGCCKDFNATTYTNKSLTRLEGGRLVNQRALFEVAIGPVVTRSLNEA